MMSRNSEFHAPINHRLARETPGYNYSSFVFVNKLINIYTSINIYI